MIFAGSAPGHVDEGQALLKVPGSCEVLYVEKRSLQAGYLLGRTELSVGPMGD